MAKKKVKQAVKKVVKKVLDSTELDEKIVAEYNKAEESGLVDTIKCYIHCYGGYVLAVGAGCTFSASLLWGTILLAGAGYWAYKTRACKEDSCKA